MKSLYLTVTLWLIFHIVSGQTLGDPLNLYVTHNHYPYRFVAHDSISILQDTIATSPPEDWANYQYLSQNGNLYLDQGEYVDSSMLRDVFYGQSEGTNYRIYTVDPSSKDTVFSIIFYRDATGKDTASAEFRHQGSNSILQSRQQYYYRNDGLIDSMYFGGIPGGSRYNVIAIKYYYNSTNRLDSVESWDLNQGFRLKSVFVYDQNQYLLYENVYQDIFSGYQYFGRDTFDITSTGEITRIIRNIDVGGLVFVYEVLVFSQSPTFAIGQHDVEFKLFPIPASNLLHLQTKSGHPQNYRIIDLRGRSFKEGAVSEQIDISNLPSGNYIFILEGWRNTSSETRFIKF